MTTAGGVRGTSAHRGVVSFRGVPYAAPPVGVRRFAAPAPVEPWQGVREARDPSPIAPQDPRSGYGWTHDAGEDHLTVDVHVPAEFPRDLPVLVWIHGGGWVSGSGSAPGYHPAAWVRRGFVVVAMNYRLGFEGFGAVPGAPHNRGLLDQIAALRWVAENVRAFGGDPDRVTIAGQSAGASSVAALMCAPAARGLFSRAIAASITAETYSIAQAERVAERVARAARVPHSRAGFAGLPPIRLLAASDAVAQDLAADPDAGPRGAVPLLYHPVVDGDVVDGPFMEGPHAGGDPGVELLVQTVADEWTLFSRSGFAPVAKNVEEVRAFAVAVGLPPAAVEEYRALLPGADPGALGDALLSDALFAEPSRRFARAHAARGGRTHLARFTWRSPFLGGRFGATHGLDVPFAFGNPQAMEPFLHAVPVLPLARRVPGVSQHLRGLFPTPASAALSQRLVQAWTGFAADGDPGWPQISAAGVPVQVWGSRDRLERTPDARERIWADVVFRPFDGARVPAPR
ncbi:para-nitrobenzyl esterase [Kineococcus rhizosphaerae]|uniref:Carboxylic ester hydrolase n=1 Tax=Kineococcus rhizosphaerae TaxID=559628 RepID=A0A2T0RB66_9ACTN|nr:para-nitrobenzyl esterase [Kineococcus rhizosphaerae]